MTARNLERVIYYENYLVIDPGKTPLEERQLLTEQEYLQAQDEYGEDSFVAGMGAEAIRDALALVDLEGTVNELRMSRCTPPDRSRSRKRSPSV